MQSVDDVLTALADATSGLLDGIGDLTDADARGPSLLPGWTRGHVLTHLARNAEGGTRLLGWAHTGIPSYEYPSVAARAAAIEEGASRPAAELVADVRATATALADAAALLQPDEWDNPVTWTTGQQTPAEHVPFSRHAEVVLHHTDLDIGYRPANWPASFTDEILPLVVTSLTSRHLTPVSARLIALDTGREFSLGDDAARGPRVSANAAELLAWLLGRSDGAGLDRTGLEGRTGLDRTGPLGWAPTGPLPPMPSIYET
jgi:maleylpyruvate isomerase